MNRVLLITPTYYPLHTPCTFRIHSFAKYLLRYGYDTQIATYQWADNNLHYDRFLKSKFFPAIPFESVCPVTEVSWRLPTRGRLVGDKTLEVLLPDYLGRRTRALFDACLALHRQSPLDAVIATTPSVFTFEVARLLKKRCGIPWIADVRDVKNQNNTGDIDWRKPWNYLDRIMPSPKSVQINRLLAAADACTTVSPGLAEVIQQRAGRRVTPRVLYNGFNPDEYQRVEVPQFAKFVVTYAGTLSTSRAEPKLFFQAVGELLQEGQISVNDFQSRWYLGESQLGLVREYARQYRCEPVVSVHGYVPKSEIVGINKASQILLQLSHPGTKGVITSKLIDCFGANRFLLAIPGDGDIMNRVISETNTGAVATSVGEVKAVILRQLRRWREFGSAEFKPRRNEVAKYTRERQVEVLAGLLDRITDSSIRRTTSGGSVDNYLGDGLRPTATWGHENAA